MTTTATDPAATGQSMTTRQLRFVMLAMLGTLLLAILDTTIVTSAASTIGRELDPVHGISQVPWLVTAYALAGTVVQPIYGKLADRHGAKSVFLWTIGLFLAGSALCGLATSMSELIVFRALQGLGGGGLMSVTFVVMGHVMAESPQRRGASALGGLMLGMGLVVGPLLGGALAEHASWRWIFYVNLPLGGLAWLAVAKNLRLTHRPHGEPIDWIGAALLAVAAGTLLLVCQWGGNKYGWGSATIVWLAIIGVAIGGAFTWRQRTASHPFFPPRLLRYRVLRLVTVLQLIAGLGMASAIVYITLELQVVRGVSGLGTGVHLLPMALGLAIGAFTGARILRGGGAVRLTIAGGQVLAAVALIGLAQTSADTSYLWLDVALVVFGTGLGLGLGNEIVLVQTTVDRSDMGMAMTGTRFIETIGTSIGASAFGLIFSAAARSAAGGEHVTHVVHALDTIFLIGGALLLVAATVALRLPDLRFPSPTAAAPELHRNDDGRAAAEAATRP
jgi:EmrB/QacA subfamily drug resistance transporter